MTDPWERPGHGPSDPEGYLIEQTPEGYRWTCRADGRAAGPFASRDEAVLAAEADRDARCTEGTEPGGTAAGTIPS